MTTISYYKNGNYTVTLKSDGTKIRRYSDEPAPEFPESLDLKVTNYCDAGCAYCHEQSVTTGKHGDSAQILDRILKLPRGVELAIGGGNPLDHPDIVPMLQEIRRSGLVPSMTVNEKHIDDIPKVSDLVYGLGISCTGKHQLPERENIVVHLIAGVNTLSDLGWYLDRGETVLVLGYKDYGRGQKYRLIDERLNTKLRQWKTHIGKYLSVGHISFDNLAINQLQIEKHLTEDQWSEMYMGNDGQFTMYFDGVKMQYAKSSVSERHDADKPIASWFTSQLQRNKT